MFNDLLEGLEAAIVHVGSGQGDVAKRGGDEAVAIGRPAGHQLQSMVPPVRESIVVEAVIGKESTAVAVEAIGSLEPTSGVIFGHEEFETPFFLPGQFGLPASSPVES